MVSLICFHQFPPYHKLFSNLYFFGGDTASRIGRELAREQRSQRNDRDKFITASRVVYGLVKQEFDALCRKFDFSNSIVANYISPHQQAIRIRKKIDIATVLVDFLSQAIDAAHHYSALNMLSNLCSILFQSEWSDGALSQGVLLAYGVNMTSNH